MAAAPPGGSPAPVPLPEDLALLFGGPLSEDLALLVALLQRLPPDVVSSVRRFVQTLASIGAGVGEHDAAVLALQRAVGACDAPLPTASVAALRAAVGEGAGVVDVSAEAAAAAVRAPLLAYCLRPAFAPRLALVT